LGVKNLRSNLQKVKEACAYAATLKIPVVALGGFTSIVLETGGCILTQIDNTYFTTGNTLTAGFIVNGIERACRHWGQLLGDAALMIIGSTGDIGAACTNYFAGKTKELILSARQPGPLQRQAQALAARKLNVSWSTDIDKLLPKADIVICVASSMLEKCTISLLPSHAIICDAGYPKNLCNTINDGYRNIFFGGMGIVEKGFSFNPDYRQEVYEFPIENAAHGCLLEAIVLAMEDTPQAFSCGRGNITLHAMDSILKVAGSHGIKPAPLFNTNVFSLAANKIG
jgi:predicted amino acid dehydrogenase